jgi:N-acetylglutamate synthase-like GNAT family acetyltransferase
MARLVPSHCQLRPAQIRDLSVLARFDRALDDHLYRQCSQRWRNFAAIAFFVFTLIVVWKDWRVMGLILLGLVPLYLVFAGLFWVNRHPPRRDWVNYWVVECKGQVVALAQWQHYDQFSYLQRLYVLPQHRVSGMGSALVERLIEQTQQPIYVLSDRDNQGFFQRFGFQPMAWDSWPDHLLPADWFLEPQARERFIPLCYQPKPKLPALRSQRLDDFWMQVEAQIRRS